MTGSLGPAWLFCPGDRPERFAKAAERSDVVILDLEDAVSTNNKPRARAAVAAAQLDPERTIVRINPVDSPYFVPDLQMVRSSGYRMVMLPKTESTAALETLTGLQIFALLETAAGVLAAEKVAAAEHVHGLMWGAEDLLASLGGTSSRAADGSYREVARFARSQVLVSARAFGKLAIDSVYLNIPDLSGLATEAADARASGFTAKALIHPSHVPIVREAFTQSDRVAWATRVLEHAKQHGGVFSFEGQMVDEPVLRQAREILGQN